MQTPNVDSLPGWCTVAEFIFFLNRGEWGGASCRPQMKNRRDSFVLSSTHQNCVIRSNIQNIYYIFAYKISHEIPKLSNCQPPRFAMHSCHLASWHSLPVWVGRYHLLCTFPSARFLCNSPHMPSPFQALTVALITSLNSSLIPFSSLLFCPASAGPGRLWRAAHRCGGQLSPRPFQPQWEE